MHLIPIQKQLFASKNIISFIDPYLRVRVPSHQNIFHQDLKPTLQVKSLYPHLLQSGSAGEQVLVVVDHIPDNGSTGQCADESWRHELSGTSEFHAHHSSQDDPRSELQQRPGRTLRGKEGSVAQDRSKGKAGSQRRDRGWKFYKSS